MIEVTLTAAEMVMGAQCGIHRHIAALRRGLVDRHGFEGIGWNNHIEGAYGEIAACKILGIYWSASVNTFRTEADAARNLQFKTRLRHDYDLIVRENDNPEHLFVLITGLTPNFRVHGYLLGIEARRDCWIQDYGNRPPAWFVPQTELHDILELRQGAHAWAR